MRRTSEKERAAVLRLDGPARYAHFVKRVVDDEAAWGLWKDGWALMGDDQGREALPLWPAREYAEASKIGAFADHSPEEIPLDDLVGELLPKLASRGILPAIFPTPEGKGVIPTVAELTRAIADEREKYGE